MKITLDRLALLELVKSDPQFELELKANVISELGRRFFEKDAAKIIAASSPELFKKALESLQSAADVTNAVTKALEAHLVTRGSNWNYTSSASPVTRALIDSEITKAKSAVELAISQGFNSLVAAAVQKATEDGRLEGLIDARVNRLVDEEVNRRVVEKFKTIVGTLT